MYARAPLGVSTHRPRPYVSSDQSQRPASSSRPCVVLSLRSFFFLPWTSFHACTNIAAPAESSAIAHGL